MSEEVRYTHRYSECPVARAEPPLRRDTPLSFAWCAWCDEKWMAEVGGA